MHRDSYLVVFASDLGNEGAESTDNACRFVFNLRARVEWDWRWSVIVKCSSYRCI